MAFVVVDYLKGNLKSVQRGLELVGADVEVTSRADAMRAADALVLPGVGSFADAAATMEELGQTDAIREAVSGGTPFLGICLGMQLLFERGSEGAGRLPGGWARGIGLLQGECVRLPADAPGGPAAPGALGSPAALGAPGGLPASALGGSPDEAPGGARLKIPHVGFNSVDYARGSALFDGIEDGSYFYFTHSYHVIPADAGSVVATTEHGAPFVSAVERENVFGVQFHPEKSSRCGLAVLRNFVEHVKAAFAGRDRHGTAVIASEAKQSSIGPACGGLQ